MASISFLKDRHKNPYRAQVKSKQFGTKVAYFPDEDTAKEWCLDREKDNLHRLKGMDPPIENLTKRTVGDLLNEYLKRRTPKKASAPSEVGTIRNLAERYKDRPLIAFTRHDAYEYRDYLETDYRWKGKSIKPATIARDVAVFKHAWDVAAEEWRGYEGLVNPWRKVKATEQAKDRVRRLRSGELDRILASCNQCKGDYVNYAPLAILLAIETGMRLQEIFGLDWTDVHLQRRRIHIRKSKTDYKRRTNGRWIVLTLDAYHYLKNLADHTRHPKEGRLFPMSKEAFKQVWVNILMRAGIPFKDRDYKMPWSDKVVHKDGEGLTFHDLRHEAASRFKRCLFVDEIGAMLGHGNKTVTEIYLEYDEDDLTAIQNKLDRYEWDFPITIGNDGVPVLEIPAVNITHGPHNTVTTVEEQETKEGPNVVSFPQRKVAGESK
jgi:integrase